jgi:hypothetical protein
LATGIIHQNLFFAFFYNALGIPLAVAGFLNPLIAVVAMFASSLTVIGNALRIARFQPGKVEPAEQWQTQIAEAVDQEIYSNINPIRK